MVGKLPELNGVPFDTVTFSTCVSVLSKEAMVPSVDTSCGTTVVTVDEKVLIPAVAAVVVCCEGLAADDGTAVIVLVYVVPAVVSVFGVGWPVLPASVDVAETEGSTVVKAVTGEAVTVKVASVVSHSVVMHGCQFGLPGFVAVTTAVYVAVVPVAVQVFVPSQ